ncbi:MAG: NADH:ubiquinone reductase (Na(+)-transporting) subunit C, partial [Venatoribacter sp.]
DQYKAAKDPAISRALKSEEDPSSIKRLGKYANLFVVKLPNGSQEMVIPVHGYGLWSTLYGFVALKDDLNTLVGLGFYSHAETPGLGGEVDNPKWKALWPGKKLYKEGDKVALTVIKGHAEASDPYHVDGLSGASLTSRGVDHLVKFWLGEQGFGKFISNLKAQGV